MVYGALWYGRNGTFQSAHHNRRRRRRRKKGHQMQEITTEQPSFPFYRYCECGIGHISIGVHWWLLCACLSVSLNFMFWLFCSAQNRFAACVAIMINSQIHTLRFYSIACSLVKRQFFFRWSSGERARTQSSFIHSFFIFLENEKTYKHFMKHGIEMDMNELPERHQRTNTWFFNMKQVFPRTYRTKP